MHHGFIIVSETSVRMFAVLVPGGSDREFIELSPPL